jgi:(S)-ureidoglycine aminohydrolase
MVNLKNIRMKTALTWLLLLPAFLFAQQDSVLSGSYEWKLPKKLKYNKINSRVLLQGKVHDFSWMQIKANFMGDIRGKKLEVPDSVEQLIIIKSGWCQIFMNDTAYILTTGSVAVLMSGQKFSLQTGKETLEFLTLQYKSKKQVERQRGNQSFVKKWEDIAFKPNDKGGGRRDFFEQSTPMQKRFEMHVTTLKEGLKSHEPHTHRAEEIVWILEGETEMQLGDQVVKTGACGFYYLGSNVPHAIKNIGTKPATYFAFQFE